MGPQVYNLGTVDKSMSPGEVGPPDMEADFIFYFHMKKYFFPSCSFAESFCSSASARCQMNLSGLCWTKAATSSMVVVWWSNVARVIYFYPLSPLPKLRNLLTHFCTNLVPGASFSCRWSNWSSTGIAAYFPTVIWSKCMFRHKTSFPWYFTLSCSNFTGICFATFCIIFVQKKIINLVRAFKRIRRLSRRTSSGPPCK